MRIVRLKIAAMVEKDKGKSTYEKTLTALVFRDMFAGKSVIDGNALAEEADRIVNKGGAVNIVLHPERNIKNPQNKNVNKNQPNKSS